MSNPEEAYSGKISSIAEQNTYLYFFFYAIINDKRSQVYELSHSFIGYTIYGFLFH